MEKTLRSFYGGSNADLGPVNMDSPPQTDDYLRWTGAYWAPASFEEPEKNLTETVRNAGFTMLPKGTPVKIVGNSGQEANVIAANATNSFPAHLVLNHDLMAGASGEAVAIGFINNVSVPDASIFTGGQEVYLGPTGGWTTTRPTGTDKIQKLGFIVKPNTGANTVSGIVDIANIQDLPNLSEGRVWIGNSSGLAEEFNLTSELSSRDTANRNRANHTGTQSWETLTGTPTTLSGYGITDGLTTSAAAGYLALAGGTMTGNLNLPSLNGGQLAGMRNKIINGKMEIAQRGTSFAAIAAGFYSLDRWAYAVASNTAALTVTQQADAPSSNEFQNSLRVAVTTADTSIVSSDVAAFTQQIEGFNVRDLIGRTFTLSFWVRSSKTGAHCVSFRNGGFDRSFIAEYAINAANTWEYKSITVSGGLITAGTWNWTTGIGLSVSWALASGSTYNTTAGSWQTGNFVATANQVNCLDTIGNIFAITGVQLEVGSVATPFEHRPYGTELALCQRYYEQIPETYLGFPCPNYTFAHIFAMPFKVTKRAVPSIVYSINNTFNVSTSGLTNTTVYGYSFQVVGAATTNTVFTTNSTASAEL